MLVEAGLWTAVTDTVATRAVAAGSKRPRSATCITCMRHGVLTDHDAPVTLPSVLEPTLHLAHRDLASELLGSCAWLFILPGVQCIADVTGGDQRSSAKLLTNAFTVAALITIVDFTFQAGMVSTTDWVSTWPKLHARCIGVISSHSTAVTSASEPMSSVTIGA